MNCFNEVIQIAFVVLTRFVIVFTFVWLTFFIN
jgi:hypothetical protein